MLSDDMLRFVFVYDARFADALSVELSSGNVSVRGLYTYLVFKKGGFNV